MSASPPSPGATLKLVLSVLAYPDGWHPMKRIVSVSRRTDIPAFYADWFMRRIEAGAAGAGNPYPLQAETPYGYAPTQGTSARESLSPSTSKPFFTQYDNSGAPEYCLGRRFARERLFRQRMTPAGNKTRPRGISA
jgi:hypothetical protein